MRNIMFSGDVLVNLLDIRRLYLTDNLKVHTYILILRYICIFNGILYDIKIIFHNAIKP